MSVCDDDCAYDSVDDVSCDNLCQIPEHVFFSFCFGDALNLLVTQAISLSTQFFYLNFFGFVVLLALTI